MAVSVYEARLERILRRTEIALRESTERMQQTDKLIKRFRDGLRVTIRALDHGVAEKTR
jgi:hypothetical protein